MPKLSTDVTVTVNSRDQAVGSSESPRKIKEQRKPRGDSLVMKMSRRQKHIRSSERDKRTKVVMPESWQRMEEPQEQSNYTC